MNRKWLAPLIGFILIIAVAVLLFYWMPHESSTEKEEAALPPAKDLRGRSIMVLTNTPHLKASEALAQWFREETGAVVRNRVVNYEVMSRRALEDFRAETPELDVIMFWYVDIGALVEAGALADLTGFIEENRAILDIDDYIPTLYDPYTLYKGRRWALPYDGDSNVLFYRVSILKKYGLKPPETWDDYTTASRIITENERENGIYGSAIMAPNNPMALISSYMNRLSGYGGRLTDDEGNPTVDSEAAVRALTAMVEQGKYALPTPTETDWEVSRDAFLSGHVAMVDQFTDIGIMAEDPAQSVIGGDWDAVQMPRGEGGEHSPALNAGFSLGISARAPDPEAARAYLLFAGRPDITLRLNLINGGIDPTRISVLHSEEYRAFAPQLSRAAAAALIRATPWPRLPRTSQLLQVLTEQIIMALEGTRTPRSTLAEAQARWIEILRN